ncbi:interleukin-13 receptor subunit alpha-1 [Misgurnus anguillicaudatus]|uniref:interleukin-13 receptor subunit alpha-1 n=1 Tax=Misgurnus anguillicaudatus TaxID=75329 RepID=UPI003CCFAA1B
MCRYWDISLVICFSLMFVGVENMPDQMPPPKNLMYTWRTPFTLYVKWEKPEDLDPTCTVNYTVTIFEGQFQHIIQTSNNFYSMNLSNKDGLNFSVTTNPGNCGNKQSSPPISFAIPPPPVMLVRNLNCIYYSKDKMMCTWDPDDDDAQDLDFYWLHGEESVKCSSYIHENMKIRGCNITSEDFKSKTDDMFYMAIGTYKNSTVINTFRMPGPYQSVRLNKPKFTIKRNGRNLLLQTTRSGFEHLDESCFSYNYTYVKCNETTSARVNTNIHSVEYDPICKYKARVKMEFEENCGAGVIEESDEVEYGEDRDPNLPVLLVFIFIAVFIFACLIGCFVLLRRHKDDLLPKIPDPSQFFKENISNIKTSYTAPSLYEPKEEPVESLSLEPQTQLLKDHMPRTLEYNV